VIVAHVFIAYFVSIKALWHMIFTSPAEHPEAFVWMLALTGVFYGNFAFFREQLCVVLCPYGRLQSVLLDDDSLVIAYDEKRGEPRGKKGKAEGDCVDCRRCIAVCPTGIDIRNGLQMDCIACTACIDACDEIMDKVERPRGLIAYKRGRILRPRVYLYTALLAIGATVFFFSTRTRTTFDASLTRLQGPPFTREEHVVRNDFIVHLVNKSAEAKTYALVAEPFAPDMTVAMASGGVEVPALSDTRIPIIVRAPDATRGRPNIRITVSSGKETRVVEAVFLGASGR
jgi:cytochrome c oxidase accessory protein FixG